KSFAKHTEIVFGEKLNCVLGPNGAGKSNVLDSLCFVLGKASSKDLRADKAANLVYNGGKAKKASKQGEVTICFSNSPRVFPVDRDEIKITRIVKDTGQSVYRMNDETVTRREIVELLSIAKIDPDGYNIILQGDIVHFVEMPPDQRRVLIEDIAGISIYEEKKHKAMLELEKVEQHLKETDIILKERESYLKELKKDRDQALKYKEMNDKIRQNKASYLRIQMDKKEIEKKEFEQKIQSLSSEMALITEKIENIKKVTMEREAELFALNKEIEEKGETEQLALNKEVEGLKIEITKLTSRSENIRHELAKLANRRADLLANLDELGKKKTHLQEEEGRLAHTIEAKQKEAQEIASRILQFKAKNNLGDIGAIEKNIEEIDKKAEEIQRQVNILREKQHDFIRQKDKVATEIAFVDDRIMKVSAVEKEKRTALEEIQRKREEFRKATLQLNKCLDEDSSHAAHLTDLRTKNFRASEELSKLKARNASIQETTRGDVAIKRILELKSQKPGIFGTIAELGHVNQKYALALEIAAGNRIKSIVVESDRIASECIKFLKQNKLGSASFLPLNKIQGREKEASLEKVASQPGSHGFAIDLVEFDPKFKKAFSYVLENTIVVDNIDVAVKLGVGTAKFVTVDGDLTERSGVMQGGFRERKKDGMGFGQKEITQEIQRYEEAVQSYQDNITIFEKKKMENEDTITSLRHLKAELEGEIIKGEKSLNLDAHDLGSSSSKRKELEEQSASLDKAIDDAISSVSEQNRGLASLKIEKQNLRSAITQLNNPALIAELNAFEQKHREISDETIRMTSELKNAQRLLKDITQPEFDKISSILKQIEKEEQQFTQEGQGIEGRLRESEKVLGQKEIAAKDFYAKFKGLFAKANSIKEDISRNQMAMEKKKDESRQAEIRSNTLSLKKAEFSAAMTAMQEEFAQYEGVVLDIEKSEAELKAEIAKFERSREEIGSVNMRALDIYESVEKQYNELLDKKANLSREKDDVANLMNEIEGRKKELFMTTFEAVNANFVKFFTMLTTKGAEANLVIEDPQNPFDAGVRINVKISGSKFLDIRSLSGGEKTMTALAFIFAIQDHEPASFYVLDEVDAALDKHNSSRLAEMLRKYSEHAQYIVISHNDGVISAADNLYGVSMNEHGISQVVSLKV
ncbi:MAG TPA: chromosome segregation protein SMC, partial [Candidatus Nanoarchaeia archaeon]|nr:chromosome segregation protein SMC [Candidatus Nanoarchaeia archaeon]